MQSSVVHRDLKSDNIFVNADLQCLIGDFGESVLVEECDTAPVAGTPFYCAPEVLRCEKFGVSSDIFSFGILLLEIITWYSGMSTFQKFFEKGYTDESVIPIAYLFSLSGCMDSREALKRASKRWLPEIPEFVKNEWPETVKIINECMCIIPDARPKASTLVRKLTRLNLNPKHNLSYINHQTIIISFLN